jgi:hypothetical protein
MIVLQIPEATPSANTTLWAHWRKKHALRKRWAWLVRAAKLEAKVFDAPKYPKATVTIERHSPRMLDADNCRAGTKVLADSLVAEGLILDDSMAVIGEPVIRQIASKTKKTVVTIEGL